MEIDKLIDDACSDYTQDQYAMYLRKSRADLELEALGEGETLARHKTMLETLAAKHDIHPDQITIYKEVVSGESIDDRPEMQRLLSDVYAKKFKGVLVVEVERLARGNTKDQGEVADAFQVSNAKIITPAKVYDPNDESDQEYFEFGLFMSRREYKTIRRRLVNGKNQSVEEGNYLLPQRIFGFNIERRSKKDRRLVENKEESPVVQMVFDWYTEDGLGYQAISNKLKNMGVKTSTGHIDWHRYTVRDMLANVHYIGKVSWGKQKSVKVFDEKKGKLVKKLVRTGEADIYEGKHDGIISEEQFYKAAEITKSRKHPSVKVNSVLKNPYAGILKCCDCGRHMGYEQYGINDGRSHRIIHSKNTICRKKSVAFDAVNSGFIEALKLEIADMEMKMEGKSDNSAFIKHQETIRLMENELAKQEKMKRRLFDLWEADDGTYTRDEFIERKQKYTKTIDELKQRIQEAKENAPVQVNYPERITTLHSIIDCMTDPEADAQAKNNFLKQFIDHIDYDVIDYGKRRGGKPVLTVFYK
jgi:hypothetical protein